MGILHAEGQAASRRAMFGGKVRRDAARLVVDDEVDVALAIERDVFAAMARYQREAELLEQWLEHAGHG
jgi:hypothetical protein